MLGKRNAVPWNVTQRTAVEPISIHNIFLNTKLLSRSWWALILCLYRRKKISVYK